MSVKGVRENYPLVSVINGRKGRTQKNAGALSESSAWSSVRRIALALQKAAVSPHGEAYLREVLTVNAATLTQLAGAMAGQVTRGIHTNPARGECMSKHVMLIAYIHEHNGRPYAHGFGDADIELREGKGGALTITGMKERTGVHVYAAPGSPVAVLEHAAGKPLVEEFPDED